MAETFTIQLAGRSISITCLYPAMKALCRTYLVAQPSGGADIRVATTAVDIRYEQQRSQVADCRAGIPVRQFSDEYLETLAVYRKIADQMLDYDTLLFHGSALAVDGVGYLFTATSGTGKSTHARLWRQHFGPRATMVNDDKPLLHIAADGVTVYGTPWDGKHRLSSNTAAPLKAICLLSRAQTNHIEKITPQQAYPLLLQQAYRSDDATRLPHTLRLLDRMQQRVALYALGCNMQPEAAAVAFVGMQK